MRIPGTNAPETLTGTSAQDQIYGYDGADTLIGGGDNDLLVGGRGADRLDGGEGIDTASYEGSEVGVYVSLVTGRGFGGDAERDVLISIENLRGSSQADLLIGNDEANTIYGARGDDTINGGGGADILFGRDVGAAPGDGNDTLKGGGGFDMLYGGDGDDMLDGGTEVDWLYGEGGNDTYVVDNARDFVWEWTGGGYDTVKTSVSYMLAAGSEVEILRTMDTTGAIDLTGNEFGNRIIGNDGQNIIMGYGGRDRLEGWGDNDRMAGGALSDDLYGGTGADTFVYLSVDDSSPTTGIDNIFDFNPFEDDRIDLQLIDADGNAANGDQAFAYAAGGVFHHVAGELRYAGGFLEGDVNGDGTADLSIRVNVDPSGHILL